jgi:hypothetical protein
LLQEKHLLRIVLGSQALMSVSGSVVLASLDTAFRKQLDIAIAPVRAAALPVGRPLPRSRPVRPIWLGGHPRLLVSTAFLTGQGITNC